MQQQPAEKKRVYALARELDIETSDLLAYCKELGYDVRNQLSNLDPVQCEALTQRVQQRGKGGTATATLPPPVAPPRHLERNVRVLPAARPAPPPAAKPAPSPAPAPAAPAPASQAPAPPAPTAPAPVVAPVASPARAVKTPTVEVAAPPAAPTPAPTVPPPAPTAPAISEQPAPPPVAPVEPPAVAATAAPNSPAPTPPRVPVAPPRLPDVGGRVRTLGGAGPGRPGIGPGSRGGEGGGRGPRRPIPASPRPAIAPNPPSSLRQPTPGAGPKPAAPAKPAETAQKRFTLTPEQIARMREAGGVMRPQDLMKKPAAPVAPIVPASTTDESEDEKGRKGGGASKVPGREDRHKQRTSRALERKNRAGSVQVQGGQVIVAEDDRPRHRKMQRKPKPRQPGTLERKGAVPINLPITVRSLSEAAGVKVGKLLMRLRDLGAPATTTINSTIDIDLAEAIALDEGVELDIRRPTDAEGTLLAAGRMQDDPPESLEPRAPVVTVMGHVDHGKTSLLDRIRQSNVVDTEAGGITQVIRAWRVERNGRPITFLDTPGHEAFTKMRARGAQVTDIAVIVVAADDGVMPQTEEAINHAKAAKVPIVVAINKVDLPGANLKKTEQQLYSLELLPDTMGGNTLFTYTSAATGKGIEELLDNILLVADYQLELKANPHKAAVGTCLEADLRGDEGVFATLLVQQGTLHRGDVVLCGATFGRVRAMYSDLGKPITEAGPSVPVRITGLDSVPDASDTFHAVADLSVAREIAEKRKAKQIEASLNKRVPMTLESLAEVKIAELKVILKADFRGSIEAIKKELEKLTHEEVRVRVLHTGIGGITESDVQLALTSPEDTIIVGFNAVPDGQALQLAETNHVQIREYNIIYNLTNDIRAALEGKLKPREEVIHLGRAVVRETFKISRVGTVAGCYVTQGTIERSAKIRLIREGTVIYPAPDKTASLESLKRFKEDTREVREGFECGIKIAGYDDIKVNDVIEAYRIEQVQRTL